MRLNATCSGPPSLVAAHIQSTCVVEDQNNMMGVDLVWYRFGSGKSSGNIVTAAFTSIMDSELTLPLDVLLHITELLADDRRGGIKSLQILSQTCKFMVPICRKHLFSSLDLVSTSISNSGHFSDLLLENPDIARYVRSLNYKLYNPFTSSLSDHELTLLNILKVRSPLKSIELFSPGLDWNDYPESIRLSLLSLDRKSHV